MANYLGCRKEGVAPGNRNDVLVDASSNDARTASSILPNEAIPCVPAPAKNRYFRFRDVELLREMFLS